MSNALYASAATAILSGGVNLVADTIRVTLIDIADYAVNLAAHGFYSDVPAAARVATATLSGVTVTNGVVDANDVVFSSVSGDPCEALLIWQDTGTPSTSRLIAYLDTASGLPVTPAGGDVQIIWSNDQYKILTLEYVADATYPSPYPLGSLYNPRRVTNATELAAMATYPSDCFELVNDIDMAGVNWTPIPNFSGTLDGRGHVIFNLQLTTVVQFGIISVLDGGTIRRIGVKTTGSGITGSSANYEGLLFARTTSKFWLVEDCYAEGTLNLGGGRGGGLYGINEYSGTLKRCWAAVAFGAGEEGRYGAFCYQYTGSSLVTSVFYDVNVMGAGGTSLGAATTTVNMKKQSTFSGWDFTNIWSINENNDYPRLRPW